MKLEYFAIRVRDLDKAIDLYTEILGLELLGRQKIEWTGGEVAALKDGETGQMLELNWYPETDYRQGDELDHLGVQVDDMEAALQELGGAGCRVSYPLEDRGKYLYACVEDPDGIWLELYEVK